MFFVFFCSFFFLNAELISELSLSWLEYASPLSQSGSMFVIHRHALGLGLKEQLVLTDEGGFGTLLSLHGRKETLAPTAKSTELFSATAAWMNFDPTAELCLAGVRCEHPPMVADFADGRALCQKG